jgi:hypothetical protein
LQYKSSAPEREPVEATVDGMTIPSFISFFEEDEIIEKYQKEREKIKKKYKDKNFLDVTLTKLIQG